MSNKTRENEKELTNEDKLNASQDQAGTCEAPLEECSGFGENNDEQAGKYHADDQPDLKSDDSVVKGRKSAKKKLSENKSKICRVITIISIFLLPIISLFMSECVHGVFIYNFSVTATIANYILFAMLYAAGVVITGSLRWSVIVVSPLIFIFSIVTEEVLVFRGTPAMPADLLSIGTGLNVAAGYHFGITTGMVAGFLIMVFMMCFAFFTPCRFITRKTPLKKKLALRLALAIIIGAFAPVFYLTDFAADHKVKPDFWDQARGYRNSGTLLNFFLNTKYLIIERPENYNSNEIVSLVDSLLEKYPDDKGILSSAERQQEERAAKAEEEARSAESSAAQTSSPDQMSEASVKTADTVPANESYIDDGMTDEEAAAHAEELAYLNTLAVSCTSMENQPSQSARLKKDQVPDVIVIMNETWADMHVLGEFETDVDYLPFTRNLTRNTIKGNLYMPVLGAGTSNSEFEFLTGNTIAFLTGGSNAYELYIKTNLPSLARTLASQGYSRTGLHPYYGNSWKRSTNYPRLGFESFLSLENMFDEETVTAYRNNDITFPEYRDRIESLYPDDQVLIRRFVSDSFDFKYLESLHEEKDERPFFMFNVTMQNHGGYDNGYTNFQQEVKVTSSDAFYPKTNRYLSLIYESDKAFEELVDYYDSIKKPVIILMFGDHQPNIENEFVEEVMGKSIDDLTQEEKQKRFVTPFVIWANYDIPEGYVDMISSNYLSTLLLQTAGLKTTKYNDFLSALYNEIPVIDTTGYITSDGSHHTFNEENEYTSLLSAYKNIEYNYLFDNTSRKEDIFYISEDQN